MSRELERGRVKADGGSWESAYVLLTRCQHPGHAVPEPG